MGKTFAFDLNQRVALTESDEAGYVIGRAEYTNQSNSYLVRYTAADGRQVEAWWAEDALDEVTGTL
jgi:hypothetical protein